MSVPLAPAGVVLVLTGALVLGASGPWVGQRPPTGPDVQAAAATQLLGDPHAAGDLPSAASSDDRLEETAARGRYTWPTGTPAPVRRGFDPPAVPWGAGHRGVDLDVAAGAPVRAAGPGVVAFAGAVAGRSVVSVQHADGVRTTYEPVDPTVAAGEEVRAGDLLGHLAATGTHCAPRTCLHWGARRGPRLYLDPLSLLRPAVVRLYPGG